MHGRPYVRDVVVAVGAVLAIGTCAACAGQEQKVSPRERARLFDQSCAGIGPDARARVPEGMQVQNLSEPQIATLLSSIHERAVDVAKIAQDRARDPRVESLAHFEEATHTRANEFELTRLGLTREESGTNGALRRDFKTDTDALHRVKNNDFDNEYLCRNIAAYEANQRLLGDISKRQLAAEARSAVDMATVMADSHLDATYWVLSAISGGKTEAKNTPRQPTHRR